MPTSVQNHPTQLQIGPGRLDLRDMLLNAGVGQFVVLNAIQFMNFLPGTCEPYAQGVQEIVKGLQRLLVRNGAAIGVDGGLGGRTVEAHKVYAGPLWYEKSWSQLYLDVMSRRAWSGFKRSSTGRYGFDIEKDTSYGPEEGMGSYMHGLGDVEGTSWAMRSGVAIPLTVVELVVFQQLQRQVNAINAKSKLPLIAVDGRIGAATAKAVMQLSLSYGSGERAGGDFTPAYVATNAAAISTELSGVMTMLGANYVADPAAASKPSIAQANGTVLNPPDGMSDTTKLVIGAVAVGAVIAMVGKKKRRK